MKTCAEVLAHYTAYTNSPEYAAARDSLWERARKSGRPVCYNDDVFIAATAPVFRALGRMQAELMVPCDLAHAVYVEPELRAKFAALNTRYTHAFSGIFDAETYATYTELDQESRRKLQLTLVTLDEELARTVSREKMDALRCTIPEVVKMRELNLAINSTLHGWVEIANARCATCDCRAPLFRCTACKRARYCSEKCQRDDWIARHKAVCTQ